MSLFLLSAPLGMRILLANTNVMDTAKYSATTPAMRMCSLSAISGDGRREDEGGERTGELQWRDEVKPRSGRVEDETRCYAACIQRSQRVGGGRARGDVRCDRSNAEWRMAMQWWSGGRVHRLEEIGEAGAEEPRLRGEEAVSEATAAVRGLCHPPTSSPSFTDCAADRRRPRRLRELPLSLTLLCPHIVATHPHLANTSRFFVLHLSLLPSSLLPLVASRGWRRR